MTDKITLYKVISLEPQSVVLTMESTKFSTRLTTELSTTELSNNYKLRIFLALALCTALFIFSLLGSISLPLIPALDIVRVNINNPPLRGVQQTDFTKQLRVSAILKFRLFILQLKGYIYSRFMSGEYCISDSYSIVQLKEILFLPGASAQKMCCPGMLRAILLVLVQVLNSSKKNWISLIKDLDTTSTRSLQLPTFILDPAWLVF